jgi:DNA-binding MurR/RpiR family transcriptional regulator
LNLNATQDIPFYGFTILRRYIEVRALDQQRAENSQCFVENQGLIETHTATEFREIWRSVLSTARFFRSLGYVDFEEVRLQAREERDQTQPYSPKEQIPDQPFSADPSSTILELRNLT